MKQTKRTPLLDNNNFLRIFSLCVACLCWLVVAMMNISDYTHIFREVPVNAALKADDLANLGLHIIDVSLDQVSAEVEGERGAVGNLLPEDLTATIQVPPTLVEEGTYDLRLVLADPGDDYRVVNYSPRQVRVRVDRLEQKTFSILPQVTGITTPEGYIIDEETVTPKQVIITGPQAEIEKIARCVVRLDVEQNLEKTVAMELPIILLDAQGAEINRAERHLSLNIETAQLVISVLREKELPLEVDFQHVPNYFPLEELQYSMSNYEVMVAGPVETIARYQSLQLAPIDLRSIAMDNYVFTFDVEMPADNVVNLDDIYSVTVTFRTGSWGETTRTINSIDLLNRPSRYEVTLLTETVPNVRITGKQTLLEELTAEDLVAQIDLADRELTPGQYKLPVRISVPSRGLVWATGEYFAVVQIAERE